MHHRYEKELRKKNVQLNFKSFFPLLVCHIKTLVSQLEKRHAFYVKSRIYCWSNWNHKSCQKCIISPVTEVLRFTIQVIQILKFNHSNNSLMLETCRQTLYFHWFHSRRKGYGALSSWILCQGNAMGAFSFLYLRVLY